MTRSLSNLIKSSYIYVDYHKKMIDHDDTFKPILQFMEDIKLQESDCDETKKLFVDGLDLVSMQKQMDEEAALMNEKSAKIIEDARKKAEEILTSARTEADMILELAREEGKKQGFAQGYEEGTLKTKSLETQLMERERELEASYEKQVRELEPKFVEVVTTLLKHVTGVVIEDRKDVLLYLMEKALLNVENSDLYVLHVSKEDYDFITEQKQRVEESIPNTATLQILEDTQLTKNQCMIETNGYYIDCSLDVELENVIRDLKLVAGLS